MSDHQTVTGTLTERGATSAQFYLRPGEVVALTATFTGAGKVSLSQVLGQPAQAYRPLIAWTTSQSATEWRNTTNQDLYLVLRADTLDVGASVAYTLADVAGDQILQEWRAADGTLAFRITDQGPVGGVVGPSLDVRAFGAVGDGVTDDTEAIQAAITACPEGGEIILSGGVFNCTSGLTVTVPITISGTDNRNTNLPASASRSMLTFSVDVAAGITTTANLKLASIVINGIGLGTSTGKGVVATSASVILDNVLVQAWDTGVAVSAGYYSKFVNSRLDYCKVAASFDNCYNTVAFGTAFNGRQESGARSVDLINGSAASFHGCSFESWRASGIALYAGASAGLFGCYFEGTPEAADTGRTVLLSTDASVSAVGCHVYVTQNVEQWIGVESLSTTGVRVFSRNNRIVYPTGSEIVDVYAPAAEATACWDVAGDNWQSPIGASVRYVEPTFTGAIPAVGSGQFRFIYPPDFTNQTSHINTVLAPYPATVPPTVASGAAISLPLDVPVVTISGTSAITSITATNHARRQVTLIFQGALTFTDGGNLKLAGDLVATADDTITLVCDGTSWFEVARSVN